MVMESCGKLMEFHLQVSLTTLSRSKSCNIFVCLFDLQQFIVCLFC